MKKITVPVVSKNVIVPFILITLLLVAAFDTVMEISTAKAVLVQLAFYGGSATMAILAALFVQKYSYKKGTLLGLGLYAFGTLLFYPAAQFDEFCFFLLSLYIVTFRLDFLETTANPFILLINDSETATRIREVELKYSINYPTKIQFF